MSWTIPNFWSGSPPDEETMNDLERAESLNIDDG